MKDENKRADMEAAREAPEELAEKRLEKAKAFLKRHGLEIVLGAGCVGLGIVCVRQRGVIEMKDKLIELQKIRIQELVSLCEEKDAWFKKLMSEALKLGSSFAGKCMVDRREMLAGR